MIYYVPDTCCVPAGMPETIHIVCENTAKAVKIADVKMDLTVSEKVVVGNEKGLHARPAAQLVHIAGKFKSSIFIRKTDGVSNADCRSVLALLMLAASCGTELEINASGCDAGEAVAAIGDYFRENFGE